MMRINQNPGTRDQSDPQSQMISPAADMTIDKFHDARPAVRLAMQHFMRETPHIQREHLAAARGTRRGRFDDVRTYVQSGNIVTRSSHRSPAKVAKAVRELVGRTLRRRHAGHRPQPHAAGRGARVEPVPGRRRCRTEAGSGVGAVGPTDPDALQALLAADTAPDVLVAKGEEIVVHYANGVHASKADRVLRRHPLGVNGAAATGGR